MSEFHALWNFLGVFHLRLLTYVLFTTDLNPTLTRKVKAANVVDMRYRVEKLGKRSYDGISGEVRLVYWLLVPPTPMF